MADTIRHYLISGRVQGVGYRAFTQRRATELKLSGWVRNLADGRVEVLAQGSNESLEQLEHHLLSGPASSHVETMAAGEWHERPDFIEFSVRHDGEEPCSEK